MSDRIKNFKCPICKKKFVLNLLQQETLPFCSKRCKIIDLGDWLRGKNILTTDFTLEELYENN